MTERLAVSDLNAIIAENPTRFTYRGSEYTGMVSGKTLRRPLEIGGFQDEPEIILVISRQDNSGNSILPQLPAVGELITIGRTTYRIESTEVDPFDCGYQLNLRSGNK